MHSIIPSGLAGVCVRVEMRAPDGWDELVESDSASSPSQRAGVAEAFAAVLAGHAAEYIVAEDARGLAGGTAMCVSRMAGIEWLHAMPLLLSGAPVARADCREAVDAGVAAVLAERARAPRTAGGEWVGYRPGAPIASANLERPAGETRWLTSAVIELEAPARLDADGERDARRWEHDRRERHELRRAERARLRCDEDPEAIGECYALHLAQARDWPGHRPPPLALLRRLLDARSPGRLPLARLFTVRSPRRLLGGLLVLDHRHETLAWWSGTHPEARDVAASRALMVWTIGWAASQGRARFNLGGSAGLSGVASFKRSLGARDVDYPVRWLVASHGSLRVRVVAALQRRARQGRHRGVEA